MKAFEPKFFQSSALELAPKILGCHLLKKEKDAWVGGRIIEVEAYLGQEDAASHAFVGSTPRSKIMYESYFHSYVYLIYGVHHCFNITCSPQGEASAILIRGLEPSHGIHVMRQRRGLDSAAKLCSGPGKLCQALDIHLGHNAKPLNQSEIFLFRGALKKRESIRSSSRVGIRKAIDKPWRFLIHSK